MCPNDLTVVTLDSDTPYDGVCQQCPECGAYPMVLSAPVELGEGSEVSS